jgi:hypothetical protein
MRAINFNAGPAGLPLPALERARDEFVDFKGSGMSILEHSHRGKEYEGVHDEAIALLTRLLGIPDSHQVLFLQGGASLQFAMVPMNFLTRDSSADYILTGTWSEKALDEAKVLGTAAGGGDHHRRGQAVHPHPEAGRAAAGLEGRLRPHHQQQHHLRHPVARLARGGVGPDGRGHVLRLPLAADRRLALRADLRRGPEETWGPPASRW